MGDAEQTGAARWWRGGVLYQIYVRSFADSNADGVGDLPGITSRLDHLQWLGVDGIWLSPITVSPDDDWGYDVADYCDVQPVLGDLHDLDELITQARARGIRVLIDLVPNHSSDRHHWFVDARTSRRARHREWYVWADPREDGSPPNNWVSIFGGPAWELDTKTGQYYLHNFLSSQPDLNWWNEEVRGAFDEILRFWLDRGVAGFRIDVAHGIVKDAELRDNPPAGPDDPEAVRRLGQHQVYNMNRVEAHDVLCRFRRVSDPYAPNGVLMGETWAPDITRFAAYFGTGEDELHLAFNFPYALAPLDAGELRGIVEATEAAIGAIGWPAWTLSNHDIGRFPSRVCKGDEKKTRAALLALLALRGTPVLYFGDEIGMPDTAVGVEQRRDPAGRDGGRTPMHWNAEAGAGFTEPDVEPWLPLGDASARNVEGQRHDARSLMSLSRDLIALRRELPDLREASYASLPSPSGVWAWRRGESVTVAVNLSEQTAALEGIAGEIRMGTERARNGERVGDRLSLGPWEGVIVSSARTTS